MKRAARIGAAIARGLIAPDKGVRCAACHEAFPPHGVFIVNGDRVYHSRCAPRGADLRRPAFFDSVRTK